MEGGIPPPTPNTRLKFHLKLFPTSLPFSVLYYFYCPYFKARETQQSLQSGPSRNNILFLVWGFERNYTFFVSPFYCLSTVSRIHEWETGCLKTWTFGNHLLEVCPNFFLIQWHRNKTGAIIFFFFFLIFQWHRSQNPPTAELKQHSSFTFFGNPHVLNEILGFWEIVELDIDLNLSSITSFVHSRSILRTSSVLNLF